MVACPVCSFGVSVTLGEALKESEAPYRCPKSGCAGWVSCVESRKRTAFDGCGACGSIWAKRADLFRDISTAVEQYTYRRRCYQKNGQEWLPGDIDRETKRYESKVEKELQLDFAATPKRTFGA
jgi:hypothetical protein